jgi:hypothetical protein
MRKFVALLIAALCLAGCKAAPVARGPGGAEPMNAQDGKHTISELGKWQYGRIMEPSPNYPQCRWEVWGLQKDGWQQLYKGKGIGKVKLPPAGVYGSAYLKSSSCGNWDPAR